MSDSPNDATLNTEPEPASRDKLLAEVAALPALPGVYRWIDAQGTVL